MFHTVRAFLEAFTADDPVVLVVKTGHAHRDATDRGLGRHQPVRR